MARHTVTSDEIIRAEQVQAVVLASANGAKKLVWYPYTCTYEVSTTGGKFHSHTMDRSKAIADYNDLP